MKTKHRIEFSISRKDTPRLWAQYLGTQKSAKHSARELAVDLKLDGVKSPRVWVDGKRVYSAGSSCEKVLDNVSAM